MNWIAAATLAGLARASAAAPAVTYTLALNDNGQGAYVAGDFAVYADDTNDNGGLQLYSINLASYQTLANTGPRTVYDAGGQGTTTSPAGFTLYRTAANADPVSAEQDITSPGNTFIYGFGQVASSFAAHDPYSNGVLDSPTTESTWNAHLLLVTGTYSGGQSPAFTSPTPSVAEVFVSNSGTSVEAATVAFATTSVPEPASLGLLGMFAVGTLARRTRRNIHPDCVQSADRPSPRGA